MNEFDWLNHHLELVTWKISTTVMSLFSSGLGTLNLKFSLIELNVLHSTYSSQHWPKMLHRSNFLHKCEHSTFTQRNKAFSCPFANYTISQSFVRRRYTIRLFSKSFQQTVQRILDRSFSKKIIILNCLSSSGYRSENLKRCTYHINRFVRTSNSEMIEKRANRRRKLY